MVGTCVASCTFSVSRAFTFFRFVLFANSRRIFQGPQLSKAWFTPRVISSNRKYWLWSSVGSSRTCLKGSSGNSKVDRSMSLQGASGLVQLSCRGRGEAGFRILGVGEAGGGSGATVSL